MNYIMIYPSQPRHLFCTRENEMKMNGTSNENHHIARHLVYSWTKAATNAILTLHMLANYRVELCSWRTSCQKPVGIQSGHGIWNTTTPSPQKGHSYFILLLFFLLIFLPDRSFHVAVIMNFMSLSFCLVLIFISILTRKWLRLYLILCKVYILYSLLLPFYLVYRLLFYGQYCLFVFVFSLLKIITLLSLSYICDTYSHLTGYY